MPHNINASIGRRYIYTPSIYSYTVYSATPRLSIRVYDQNYPVCHFTRGDQPETKHPAMNHPSFQASSLSCYSISANHNNSKETTVWHLRRLVYPLSFLFLGVYRRSTVRSVQRMSHSASKTVHIARANLNAQATARVRAASG